MNNPQTFIFIGRSGCGKGTQLELLRNYIIKKDLNILVKNIIMGDIFRDFFKKEGHVYQTAREITNQGKFQPDFLTSALFVSGATNIIDLESILFIDGYPRTINQLDVLKQLFLYVRRGDITFLNINVSAENVTKRMLARGRIDDTEEAIKSRLNEFDTFVAPMIDKIKEDTSLKYFEIDGEPSKEEIHNNIISKLGV